MIISIASGKGGTGKTTIATNLAAVLGPQAQLLDCDVEQPNAHLFLQPNFYRSEPVYTPVPEVNRDRCTLCGECESICQFKAIVVVGDQVMTFPELCHSCGGCFAVCPEDAITETGRELGTIEATSRPVVILTANGTRDLSDALRRRCMYAWVDYPDRAIEIAILAARCPEVEERLAAQIVGFVQALRREELDKVPGVAETLDFAAALAGLGVNDLTEDPAVLQAALATLLKTRADRANMTTEVAQRLAGKAA